MKKQMKLVIGVIVLVVIVVIAVIIGMNAGKKPEETKKGEEYTQKDNEGNKVNTSETLKKERKQMGYLLKNITLKTEAAQTVFSLAIQNETTSDIAGKMVDIVFLDKQGKEEARMALYIRAIKAGETITTQATVNNDFTNVYDFKLEERKK